MGPVMKLECIVFIIVICFILVHGEKVCNKQGNGRCDMERRESEDALRLILLGKTGSGKSSTGNTILGEKRFKAGRSFRSTTKETQVERKRIHGQMVEIMDTPNLFDNRRSDEERSIELFQTMGATWPGTHVFLYVLQARDLAVIDFLPYHRVKTLLGNIHEHLIVVFTHLDLLAEAGVSEESFLNTYVDELKMLLEDCGRRYVFFDNQSENSTQVDRLFEIVKAMEASPYQFTASPVFSAFKGAVKELLTDIDAKEEGYFSQKMFEFRQGWFSFGGYTFYLLSFAFLLSICLIIACCFCQRR